MASEIGRRKRKASGNGSSVGEFQERRSKRLSSRSTFAAVGANSDLICRVACFLDTGRTLYYLCTSVGPTIAREVRRAYLHENETYVLKNLKAVSTIPLDSWIDFVANLSRFDRCRDNIRAWMSVNTDWRAKVTEKSINKYKSSFYNGGLAHDYYLELTPHSVFNNLALAVEVGLSEVVENLVNHDVSTGEEWAGFNSNGLSVCYSPLYLALFRGDPSLVQILLRSKDVDIREILGQTIDTHPRTIYMLIMRFSKLVDPDCVDALFRFGDIDLNFFIPAPGGGSPLLEAILVLDLQYVGSSQVSWSETFDEESAIRHIRSMLEAGADPNFVAETHAGPQASPINNVRRMLVQFHPLYDRDGFESRKSSFRKLIKAMEMWTA